MALSAAIFGTGVSGLCAGVELCKAGHNVTLFEKAGEAAIASCSWLAGGMLAPWCEAEHAPNDVVTLGQEALSWWCDYTPSFQRKGSLVLTPARDRQELTHFARRTSHYEWIDEEALSALEPDLSGRFSKGLYFAQEAHLDPRQALLDLVAWLKEAGACFETGTTKVPCDVKGDFDHVIDCRGLAAQDVRDDLRGVRGEMLLLKTSDISLSRPVRLLHPRHPLYIVPRENNIFMLGATMIESNDRRGVTARSMVELLNSAYALHPAFAEAEIVDMQADIRPAYEDNIPRIDERQGITYINGMYRHGFLLAPAMAMQLAGRLKM
jgi:glycine oxidase